MVDDKVSSKKVKRVHTKQETTALKIELAGAEIQKENKRRKKFNASRAVVKGNVDPLPMIYPSYIATQLHGRPGVTQSNKILCGKLSVLCDTMRWAGITYPWRPQEA